MAFFLFEIVETVLPITGRKPPDEGLSGGFRFLYEKVFL